MAFLGLLRIRTLSSRIALVRGPGAGACILAVTARPACCSSDDSLNPVKAAAAALGAVFPRLPRPADSADGLGGPTDSTDGLADYFVHMAWPVLSRLGFAGILGVCCAQAAKMLTKTAAAYVGGAVVVLQVLAHMGYITVHWERIKKELEGVSDADGDGNFTARDLNHWTQRALKIMSKGLPRAGAFGAGFWYGLAL